MMVPLVPTGMKTGVARGPWGRWMVAARARFQRAWTYMYVNVCVKYTRA